MLGSWPRSLTVWSAASACWREPGGTRTESSPTVRSPVAGFFRTCRPDVDWRTSLGTGRHGPAPDARVHVVRHATRATGLPLELDPARHRRGVSADEAKEGCRDRRCRGDRSENWTGTTGGNVPSTTPPVRRTCRGRAYVVRASFRCARTVRFSTRGGGSKDTSKAAARRDARGSGAPILRTWSRAERAPRSSSVSASRCVGHAGVDRARVRDRWWW